MYQARYIRMDGTAGTEVTLPAALFDGVIHEGALHQAVTAYLANQRQGTVQRKNRSAVAGGQRDGAVDSVSRSMTACAGSTSAYLASRSNSPTSWLAWMRS